MSDAEISRKIASWSVNAKQFVNEAFGVVPDKWQEKALEYLPSEDPIHSHIALSACAGPGKSAVLAWAGWWFLATKGSKYDHPKGQAVSITGDNLKTNLWSELSNWQGRNEFLKKKFRWTAERIFAVDHPSTWMLEAKTFPKAANKDQIGLTLAGLHARYVLNLIDESGGIPPQILDSADQSLTTQDLVWGKVITAGNPVSKAGALYAAVRDRLNWTVIKITGDPDDPNRSPRINIEKARAKIAKYGRDNPWVRIYILGEFPDADLNALLSIEEVEESMRRHYRKDVYEYSQKRLGCDVARFGDDKTIIFPRQGLVAFKPAVMRNQRSNMIADRLIDGKIKWGSELEFVDTTGGYGAGVVDAMIVRGYAPIEVQFAGKALDPRFFNKRAEILWNTAEWIKRGGALPPEHLIEDPEEFKQQLTETTYTFKGDKIIMEPKEDLKERLGFSPDYFDALGCTFALPEQEAALPYPFNEMRDQGKTKVEYDPFDPSRA